MTAFIPRRFAGHAGAVLSLSAAVDVAVLRAQSAGARGIEAARRGGVVIACRHAITERFEENEMTLRYEDASTQRRLSARGERQAQAMSRAFRALSISIDEAVASPMQRTRRTAELFGARDVVLDSAWHTRGENYSGWKRERRIEALGRLPRRGNRVIVSHIGTMQSVLPSLADNFQEGDCLVVRPMGGDRHEVIETVRWREWLRAAQVSDSVP